MWFVPFISDHQCKLSLTVNTGRWKKAGKQCRLLCSSVPDAMKWALRFMKRFLSMNICTTRITYYLLPITVIFRKTFISTGPWMPPLASSFSTRRAKFLFARLPWTPFAHISSEASLESTQPLLLDHRRLARRQNHSRGTTRPDSPTQTQSVAFQWAKISICKC